MSLGKHDTVTIKVIGAKVALQKWHLFVTLDELYELLIKEYHNVSVSWSKFISLSPSCVLLNNGKPKQGQ